MSDLFDDCRNCNLLNSWVIDFEQSLSTSIFMPSTIANCYNRGKYGAHRSVREEAPEENRQVQCFPQTRSNAQGHGQVSEDTQKDKDGRIAG